MQANDVLGFLPLLHIDDCADDRALVGQAIFLTGTHFEFREADGLESAIPYFQSISDSKQCTRPALILLDYNLDGHTGVDFLYWLRVMKKISFVPVVMFSSTADERNIAECYSAGANHFISKPTDLARLKTIVRTLHQSILPLHPPGLLRLLHEYQPDPREESDAHFKTCPSRRRPGADRRHLWGSI